MEGKNRMLLRTQQSRKMIDPSVWIKGKWGCQDRARKKKIKSRPADSVSSLLSQYQRQETQIGVNEYSLSKCMCVWVWILYKSCLVLRDPSASNSFWTGVGCYMHAHVCILNQTLLHSQWIVHAYWEDSPGTKDKENNHEVHMKIPVWPSIRTMWPYPRTSFWMPASLICLLHPSLRRKNIHTANKPSRPHKWRASYAQIWQTNARWVKAPEQCSG